MTDATRFAINTYSYIYSHPARRCIEHLSGKGYREFEFLIFPGHVWPVDLDRHERHLFSSAARASHSRILTLNIPNLDVNIGAADAGIREHSLRLIEATLELAADIEAPCVLIGPGKPNPLFPMPNERLLGHLFAGLDRVLPFARRLGVKIALENLPISFLPSSASMMEALDQYGDEEVGIVYDVANAFFIGEDPSDGLRAVGKRLSLIHVSDTTREAYRHDPVGLGSVPFAGIAKALKEIQLPVPTMLEIISREPDRDIQLSAEKLLTLGWPLNATNQH